MFLYKYHSIFDSRGWFVDSGAPELQWEDDCGQKCLQFPIDFHHQKWRCRCDHSGSNVLEFLKFTTKTHMGFIPSREYDLRMPEKRKYLQLIFWRPQECMFCKNQLLATTKVDLFHVTSSPQKWQCRCDLSGRNVLQFLTLSQIYNKSTNVCYTLARTSFAHAQQKQQYFEFFKSNYKTNEIYIFPIVPSLATTRTTISYVDLSQWFVTTV